MFGLMTADHPGRLERVFTALYGDPERNVGLDADERLRLLTVGGARAYALTLALLVAIFTPLTALLGPDDFGYNGSARILLLVGTVVGLWNTFRPGYRGSGTALAMFMSIGVSAMLTVEVALLGQPDHPWTLAPAFFLLGVALFVPIRPVVFFVLALVITAMPYPLWGLHWVDTSLAMKGLYLTFTGSSAVVGALVCRQRRGAFLAQVAAEEALRERTAALAEALDVLRRTQRQLVGSDRMAMLGKLTSGFAQRLDNPLMAIHDILASTHDEVVKLQSREPVVMLVLDKVGGQLAEGTEAAEQAREYLTELTRQTKTLRANDRRRFDVFAEVRAAIRTLDWRSHSLGVPVEVTGMGGIELEGDAGQFSQVVCNLMALALDRCESTGHGAEIIADVGVSTRGVVVRIVDTGGTISPSLAGVLFEPMTNDATIGGGTGLELSMCRDMMAAAFGGDIVYQPNGGRGATFSIVVPPTVERHPLLRDPPTLDDDDETLSTR